MSRYTALSIVAPQGANIASGRKTLEVRSWVPPKLPLLDLLIVENERFLREEDDIDPNGRAVALVDVLAVAPWQQTEVKAACSSGWAPGYYAWMLDNVRPISSPPKVRAERKLYEVQLNLSDVPSSA